MADEKTETDTGAAETTGASEMVPQKVVAKKAAETMYQIHNMVRRVETRMARKVAPRRDRMNLLLGGGTIRIPRGRHANVAESLVRRLQAELVGMEERGAIKLTDAIGRRVDIRTLQRVEEHAPTPKPPQLEPDPGALKNAPGFQVGVSMPTNPGRKGVGEDVARPSLFEGKEEEKDLEEVEAMATTPKEEEMEVSEEDLVLETTTEESPETKPKRSPFGRDKSRKR